MYATKSKIYPLLILIKRYNRRFKNKLEKKHNRKILSVAVIAVIEIELFRTESIR